MSASRRQFLVVTLGSAAMTALAGCKGGGAVGGGGGGGGGGSGGAAPALTCTDVSALSPAEAQVRVALGYEDRTTDPGKRCITCQQFVTTTPSACGACKLMKGPIHADGNCKAWVPKTAG